MFEAGYRPYSKFLAFVRLWQEQVGSQCPRQYSTLARKAGDAEFP